MADNAKEAMQAKEAIKPAEEKSGGQPAEKSGTAARRAIPGNLPYLTSSGTLKRMLDKIIELAKPDKFNYDFLENVAKMSGGAARACIPILKKMQFLNTNNSPTELYSKFRTETGRSEAAYLGLKNAFPEVFRRSDYAYSVEDNKLRDIIVEITGLKSSDPIAQAIKGTFTVIKSFISNGFTHDGIESAPVSITDSAMPATASVAEISNDRAKLGISYQINIVLPETSDLNVLNAIFRSLKENLLR